MPRAGGLTEREAAVRAVNAEPWEPMPGMEKRQCPVCRYWFAADLASIEPSCPDCVAPLHLKRCGKRAAGAMPGA